MSSWGVIKWGFFLALTAGLMWCVGSQAYLDVINMIKSLVSGSGFNPTLDW